MKDSEDLLQFIKDKLVKVSSNLDSYETVTNRMIYKAKRQSEWLLQKELIRDSERETEPLSVRN